VDGGGLRAVLLQRTRGVVEHDGVDGAGPSKDENARHWKRTIEWSIMSLISLQATSEIGDGQRAKRVKRGSRGVDQSWASDKQ
jgi:hypothetical protein